MNDITQATDDELLNSFRDYPAPRVRAEISRRMGAAAAIRDKLEAIVCTAGIDAGVVLLDVNGTTHTEIINGQRMQVYDHDYFSPLGDALIELWKLAGGAEPT